MEIETKRSMNNFLLYCKGWLVWTGKHNTLKELNAIFDLDNYGPGGGWERGWSDVLEILMNNLDELNKILVANKERDLGTSDFIRYFFEQRSMLRSFGKQTSMEEMVANTIISFVRRIPARGLLKMYAPTYSNSLRKKGFISPFAYRKPGTTYAESNKLAKNQLD